MIRIPELNMAEMNQLQLRIRNDILAGPRGSLEGPFNAWLHSPEFAEPAQKLGEFCRYSSSLPRRLSELAILVIAKYWEAQLEWHIHAPAALQAGLLECDIELIRTNKQPDFQKEDERAVHQFVKEILNTRTVSQLTYDQAHEALGNQGVVDLVGLVGYYCLVSITLNVFDMPLPDGVVPPL